MPGHVCTLSAFWCACQRAGAGVLGGKHGPFCAWMAAWVHWLGQVCAGTCHECSSSLLLLRQAVGLGPRLPFPSFSRLCTAPDFWEREFMYPPFIAPGFAHRLGALQALSTQWSYSANLLSRWGGWGGRPCTRRICLPARPPACKPLPLQRLALQWPVLSPLQVYKPDFTFNTGGVAGGAKFWAVYFGVSAGL